MKHPNDPSSSLLYWEGRMAIGYHCVWHVRWCESKRETWDDSIIVMFNILVDVNWEGKRDSRARWDTSYNDKGKNQLTMEISNIGYFKRYTLKDIQLNPALMDFKGLINFVCYKRTFVKANVEIKRKQVEGTKNWYLF